MGMTLDFIKRYCNRRIYENGYELYKKNKVLSYHDRFNKDLGLEYMGAVVEGSKGAYYDVTGIYRESDDILYDYTCTCDAYESYQGICKHCVALLLEYYSRRVGEVESGSYLSETSPVVKQLLNEYSMQGKIEYIQPKVTGMIHIEPTLVRSYKRYHLEFKIGADTLYVMKNIDQFAHAMEEREEVFYGKKLSFIHDESAFDEDGQAMAEFICHVVKEDMEKSKQVFLTRSTREFAHGKELYLVPRTMEEFLALMVNRRFNYQYSLGKSLKIMVLAENPSIYVTITAIGTTGIKVSIPMGECILGSNYLYIRQKDKVYQCNKKFSRELKTLFLAADGEEELTLELFDKDIEVFCATILPVLKQHCAIDSDGVELEKYIRAEAVCKVFLEMTKEKEVVCSLRAYYEEESYDMLDGFTLNSAYRQIEKESAVLQIVLEYFEQVDRVIYPLILKEGEEFLYLLLHEGINRLNQVAEVYIDENIRKLKVHKAPKIHIGLTLGPRLLELKVVTKEFPMNEIMLLLENYRRRKKYYRMKNGDFMQIDDSSLALLAELYDGMDIKENEMHEGLIALPRFRALYLDQILKDYQEDVEVIRNQAYNALLREMKAIEESDYIIPDEVAPILRNYQKTGYRWMRTLEHFGFGGILADDMGLGKTLQVITLLLSYVKEAKTEKMPALIIAPASLVYNWEDELHRFAPNLKVGMIVGSAKERKERLHTAAGYDVLVTSYDLLKRDTEWYEEKEFSYEIIDEAQAIKNHTTQAAQAVKAIHARTKFALTGTPIENRLEELWSLFDYLMPGMLFNYSKFRKELEMPIVLKKDEVCARRMQQMIKPFILRRMKKDVLKELPEKEEMVVYTKLEGEQLVLYSAHVQKLKKRLAEQSYEEFNNSKIQTLAELTKLRQLCCDPSLLYENYRGGSAKIATCLELLRGAIESGNKVLLFSQFTSMLSVLEAHLKKERIGYYKLTGQTSKEERRRMVSEFGQKDIPLFLISLKAGGTGLNLTAANIVIHFDPWWNLAAENQATDRAHRIGQDSTVTVYKIIAKDSIEENILKLQQRKKGLAEQIISNEGVSIAELTKEDLMNLMESM